MSAVRSSQSSASVGASPSLGPTSGAAAKAASGQMTMMTSGRPEAYARCGGVLEAMAMGLPIIATPHTAAPVGPMQSGRQASPASALAAPLSQASPES